MIGLLNYIPDPIRKNVGGDPIRKSVGGVKEEIIGLFKANKQMGEERN